MKIFICILFLFFTGCNRIPEKQAEIAAKDSAALKDPAPIVVAKPIALPDDKRERAKYHTSKEQVIISTDGGDTLTYLKKDFNDIVDNFPELYSSPVADPDYTFNNGPIWVDLVDSAGNKDHLSFNSEVGQDEYYRLYAYFLKNKNGIAKYGLRRQKLKELYRYLNELYGALTYGGTYFGHQYRRIEGYAEFSVYWFRHYADFFDRPYDISKQKAFYIGGLKQLVLDEEKIDNNTVGREKIKRRRQLFGCVNKLEELITDNFYLRMAQSFQSDHY